MKGEVGQRWSLDPQPWSMTISVHLVLIMAAQVAPVVKNPPVNAGDERDMGSVPGWEDPWRRKWQSTPVFLPGKSHGQRSLVGPHAWDHKRAGHD